MKSFFIYILTNYSNTVLYIGVTNNLSLRTSQHKQQINQKNFTTKYNLYKLIYYERFESIKQAIIGEKQLKKWKRIWKEDLIKSINPDFQDLQTNPEFIVSG